MSLTDKKYNLHRDCNLSQTSSSGLSDCEDSSDSELERLKKLNYKKYLPSPRAPKFTKSQICKHFGVSKKKEIIASTPVFKIRRQKSDSLLEPSISLSPIEKQYEPIETCNLLLKKSVDETHNLEILKKKKRPSDIAFKIENEDRHRSNLNLKDDYSSKKDLKRPPYPLINLVRLPIKKSYTNVKSTQISRKSVNNVSPNYENEGSHKLKNFSHSKRYTKDILEENLLKGQGDVVTHEKLNENTNCSLLRSHNFTKESKKVISNIEKKKNTPRDAIDSDLEIAPSKSLVKCKNNNLCEVDFSHEESENEDCINTDQNLNSRSQRSKIEEKNENQLNLYNSKSLMKITKGKKRHSVEKNANINQSQLIVADDVPSKNSTKRGKIEGNSDGSSLEPIFNAIKKEVIKFFGDKDSSNVDNLNPFQKGLKHKSSDEIETPKQINNRQLEEVEDRNIEQQCSKSKRKTKTTDDATHGYFCGLFENNEANISNVQEKENISPISRDNPHTGKMHISNKSIPKKLFDDKKEKSSFSHFCNEDSSSSKKSQQRNPETTLSKTIERNLRSNQKKLQETHKNSENNSKKKKIDTMEEKQKEHKTRKYNKHENKTSISIDFEQLQNEKINKRYNISSNLSMASNQDSELLGIRKSTRIRKQTRKLCIETLVLTSKPYYRRKIHEDDRNSNNPSEKYSFKVPTSKPLKVKKQQAKISEVVQQGSGVAQSDYSVPQPDSGYSSNESKKRSKSTRRQNSINFETEEENGQFSTKLGNLHPIVEENDEKAINNDINSEVKTRRTQRHGKRKTSKVKVLQGNKENNQLHEELNFQQQMSSDNDQFIDAQEVSNCHLNHTKTMEAQQKLPNIANLSSATLRNNGNNESQCISDFQNNEDFNALNTICYAVNNYAQRSNWHYSGPKLIPVQGENGVHMAYSVCNQNLGFCTFSMGFLQIDANCLKKQCYFKTSYVYYIVTEGQAYVTVDQRKKELGVNDSFFVPLGKDYSICNRNTDKLILAFTIIKAPQSLP